jgi:hypothetical protein
MDSEMVDPNPSSSSGGALGAQAPPIFDAAAFCDNLSDAQKWGKGMTMQERFSWNNEPLGEELILAGLERLYFLDADYTIRLRENDAIKGLPAMDGNLMIVLFTHSLVSSSSIRFKN